MSLMGYIELGRTLIFMLRALKPLWSLMTRAIAINLSLALTKDRFQLIQDDKPTRYLVLMVDQERDKKDIVLHMLACIMIASKD